MLSSSKEAGGNKKINNRGRLQDSVNGVRKDSDRLMGLSEKAKKKKKKRQEILSWGPAQVATW